MSKNDAPPQMPDDRPEWDDRLGERLRGLETDGTAVAESAIDRMYGNVREQCDKEDKKWTGYLRSRSTGVRRLILCVVLAVLGAVAFLLFPMVPLEDRSSAWWITLGLYTALMGLCLFATTRPLQMPALSTQQVIGILTLVLGITVGIAFIPFDGTLSLPGGMPFAGCMSVGLLLGLPVFAIVRLFDRGNAFGALMTAAAAGLAGNVVLTGHCPVDTTAHLLFGHASVAFVFVVGLGLLERLARGVLR